MQRNTLALIGLVVFGVLALGLTLMMVLPRGGKQPAPAQGDATPAPVVKTLQYVAQQNISPRTLITRSMVREEETDQAAEGGFSSFQDLQGRMVTQTVYAGEAITADRVTEPLARVTPANFPVPPGTRAVAVMVDPNQTVGGLVDAGDHVDVVVVHKLTYKTTQGLSGETRSGRTIAQNLLVLATDKSIQQAQSQPPEAQGAAPGANAGATKGAPPPPPPPPPPAAANAPPTRLRVVLAAPPAEAERIAAAQESGNIHLTLRDPSTPEEFPVPETFEYPVRFVPRPDTGGGQRSAATTRPERSSRSVEPIYPRPSMPSPSLQPMPVPAGTGPSAPPPPAPSGSEVTVIRGTEKTRVLVPTG